MEKHSLELWSPQLRNRRYVDVYLPDSYGEDWRRRYPTVYMQDGQNLSDPAIAFGGNTWRLDEGLPWLRDRGIEAIVVGVHNTPQRLSEYSPFPDGRHGGGDADRYARFLIDTVKGRVDDLFRTSRERDATVIAGSSMGGLFSLYAFFRRPSPFGRAAVMSPSIWFGGRRVLDYVEAARHTRGRIYLDVGTAEGPGTLRDVRLLARILRAKGYSRGSLKLVVARGGRHSEGDWALRFPSALEYLLR